MEEIYVNVENDKSVHSRPSTDQTGPSSSERRFYRAVVLCLGLLSVFLLAGLIGLSVHYHNSARDAAAELSTITTNLTELLQDSRNKVSALTQDRDELNSSLSSLTAEKDQLNVSLIKTTEELNFLQRLDKKTCPAGWRMFSCSCYFLSSESGSWERGRQDCKDREADLVVIDTAEEQTFLSGLTTAGTWIGLTDREEEGTWRWIDGASLTLSYWANKQPDNGGGDKQWGEEDCAHMRTGKKTEENWNDRSCDASLLWICEKKAQH